MDEVQQIGIAEDLGTTVAHPVGLAMLLLCGILTVTLPRRYALWPFLVLLCFVSARQCIAIAGFNLYFARFMILFFLPLRVLIHNDAAGFKWTRMDWLMVAFGVVFFVTGALNFGFNPGTLKFRAGYAVELVGTYFLCRLLIRDLADAQSAVRCLAILALVSVGFFVLENRTGRNLFSVFGGIPPFTMEREGRLRCQGAFAHPIIAGTFWSILLPLLTVGVIDRWKDRWLYLLGGLAALLIIVLTASSTPVLGVAFGFAGWALFRVRRYARWGFLAAAILTVLLHMVMKAPVWSLIGRINITSGNSGFHRYMLVDGFINHFGEWWLLGSTVGTAHWGHFTHDAANQFVNVGTSGGIVLLGIFFAIIGHALFQAGRINKVYPLFGWSLGISVFVMAVCFLGISVWAQMHLALGLPLAVIGSMGAQIALKRTAVLSRRKTASPAVLQSRRRVEGSASAIAGTSSASC